MLGEKAGHIQPIFITIDPTRDTTAVMAAYVANFHKAYMPAETDSNDKGIEVRERDPEEPFFFEPTAAIYLIGPDGEYIGQFSQSADLEAMAEDLSKIVE